MHGLTTPAGELQARLENLQNALQDKGIDGALIIQKTDLFYFSGTSQQGWLYVPESGDPVLMVFKEFERARQESAISRVISITGTRRIPEVLAEGGYASPSVLGMELDVLPVNLYHQYRKIFPAAEVVDVSSEIRLIRAVKSDYELEMMKKAASCSDKVAAKVPEILEAGRTEVEVAGELEAYARSLGHQGIVRMRLWGSEMFYGHLMCGGAAAVPSYLASPTGGKGVSSAIGQGAGFNRIEKNQPVLVDYVFALDGYLSDHTRIFCIGTLPDELTRAHEAMLEVQETCRPLGVPGAVTGEIYDEMVSFADRKGISEYFMGTGDRKIRFTGHGLGLELDEFPFIAKGQRLFLEEGMTVAMEPKAIFPGRGVVGIENTHVVTAKGFERLTVYPDEIVYL